MIRVTCAIIRNEDKEVLVVQRGMKKDHPLKWEFPGGKIKDGEPDEECILREIREELSMDIVICGKLPDVEYDYGIKHIVLVPFVCDTLEELPVLSEHLSFMWIFPGSLLTVDLLEADIIVAGNFINSYSHQVNKDDCRPDSPGRTVNEEELRSMVTGVRSTRETEFIAASACENPAILGKILEYSFAEDKKLSFHASWAQTKICDKYPELVVSHLPKLVDRLGKCASGSVERSFLRVISLADLTELDSTRQGILADHCFAALRSSVKAIAVKAYSMEILYRLTLLYPDLTKELTDTINMLRADGSAGIIAKGKIVLKRLERDLKGKRSSPP